MSTHNLCFEPKVQENVYHYDKNWGRIAAKYSPEGFHDCTMS